MADDDLGTAEAVEQVDQGTEAPADAALDTAAAAAGATDTAPKPAVDDPFDRPFINPAELPDELKPHWKSMHRAHNKKLDEIREHKADVDMVRKFRTDPAFARELIQYEAQRLGLHLAPANGTTTPATAAPATSDGPPARLVEAIKNKLDPSLHWMAESLAAGQWEAAREATRPLIEKDRAKDQAARDTEWGALAGKLTETAPGWEAHETDMNTLLDWLKSPALTHPQFGDKLTFLYNAVTNGSAAKAEAIRAMGDAARSATRTGQSGRATQPNVTERVRKATSPREAMKIAAEEAEREMRAAGMAVPD